MRAEIDAHVAPAERAFPPLSVYEGEPLAQETNGRLKPDGTLAPSTETSSIVPTLALIWYATLNAPAVREHVVKNLIVARSFILVFGDSNSGKTFFILDLCLAVAAGRVWSGRRTQRGLVIYIAGEGAASLRARVAAYRKHHPECSGELPFAVIPSAVDFLCAETITALIATIRVAEAECGEEVALVVIDTLARAMAGADENSAQDMGTLVAAADRLREETGAAVVFIHHAGKDPSRGARGSSALRAATDTEILIEGTGGPRTATVTKQRDLDSGHVLPFALHPVEIGTDPDDGTPITSCAVIELDGGGPSAAAVTELRGKSQRQFVAGMRSRAGTEPERIYTLSELRQIARDMGMVKATARSVVDAIVATPYMQTCAFGYRFTDGRVEKVEEG